MALCLAAGAATARLALAAFTLAWTHSVEKVRWEEDWRVEGGKLHLVEARVKGSGAGMEPPEGSVLAGGYWRYRPAAAPLARLDLARGGGVADWRLCAGDGGCRAPGELLPGLPAETSLSLTACP